MFFLVKVYQNLTHHVRNIRSYSNDVIDNIIIPNTILEKKKLHFNDNSAYI